jgi:hypothetical protein
MVAPVEDRLVDVTEAATGGPQPQHEVVVLRPVDGAVRNGVPAREQRRMADRTLDEQVTLRGVDRRQRVEPALVAPQPVRRIWKVRDPAPAGVEPLLLERRELRPEPAWPRDVVGPHGGDVAAARFGAGALRRGDESARLLAQDAKTTISQRPLARDVARRVTRTVIDDDDLQVLVRLLRERPQRLVQVLLPVANRHQHRDERPGWASEAQPVLGKPSIARSARSISS